MSKGQRKRLGTAYHEAGHAVADTVLGLHVTNVEIVRRKDTLGRSSSLGILRYEGGSRREQRSIARDAIISAYAGVEAQRLVETPEVYADDADRNNAFWLSRTYCVMPRNCSYVGDDSHVAYLERLRTEAKRLVRREWTKIEAVATELLAKRKLTGDRVREICARVTGGPMSPSIPLAETSQQWRRRRIAAAAARASTPTVHV